MAKTYSAIQTITVGSGGASSVTFFNIPQNYTDLVVKYSSRAVSSGTDWIAMTLGSGGSYTQKYIIGTGSAAGSGTNQFAINENSTFTANTFSNGEIYIPNYTSSNAKSASADSVNENNATNAYSVFGAFLWSGTSAISSITFATDIGTNIAQYSTFTLYGIGTGAKASGGTVTGSGNYMYHTFTSSSTFSPTERIKNAELFILGGGGAGGGSYGNWGGGGGAGGIAYATSQTLPAGNTYVVTVGAGGSGVAGANGSNGNNSFVGAFIGYGGGGGGAGLNGNNYDGSSGGCGGGYGGAYSSTLGGSATQPTSGANVIGYGFSAANATGAFGAGGGGGTGQIGGTSTLGGGYEIGGNGTYAFTSWQPIQTYGQNVSGLYYIGGGGGGAGGSGTGGYGGGGLGATFPSPGGSNGSANAGGGGGGYVSSTSAGYTGGYNGGSGLVVIRYPIN